MKPYFETTPIAFQFFSQEQLRTILNYMDRPGELYAIGGYVSFFRIERVEGRFKLISRMRFDTKAANFADYAIISFEDFLFLIDEQTSFYPLTQLKK